MNKKKEKRKRVGSERKKEKGGKRGSPYFYTRTRLPLFLLFLFDWPRPLNIRFAIALYHL